MALQVAKRAVVGEHVEPIAGALEGASRPVAAVRAIADVGAKDRQRARRPTDAARSSSSWSSGRSDDGVQRGGDDFDLAVRIEIGQRHLVARLWLDGGESPWRRSSSSSRMPAK